MYISKCPHDIHGLLCRCRPMVIFHQIKLFGMLSNELTAFNTLVDVVADAALMNEDHSNALCCPVKLNISYFPYSHTNSLHTAYGKHKKCQHSKKKNKNDQNKTQHCLILLSPPGTISRPLNEQDQLIMLNFCKYIKAKTSNHSFP